MLYEVVIVIVLVFNLFVRLFCWLVGFSETYRYYDLPFCVTGN